MILGSLIEGNKKSRFCMDDRQNSFGVSLFVTCYVAWYVALSKWSSYENINNGFRLKFTEKGK